MFVSLALETALNLIEGFETGHLSMDVRKDTTDDEESDSEETISLDALSRHSDGSGMEDAWFGEMDAGLKRKKVELPWSKNSSEKSLKTSGPEE